MSNLFFETSRKEKHTFSCPIISNDRVDSRIWTTVITYMHPPPPRNRPSSITSRTVVLTNLVFIHTHFMDESPGHNSYQQENNWKKDSTEEIKIKYCIMGPLGFMHSESFLVLFIFYYTVCISKYNIYKTKMVLLTIKTKYKSICIHKSVLLYILSFLFIFWINLYLYVVYFKKNGLLFL